MIRKRTGAFSERARVVLIIVNALEDDARGRGLLEGTIRITKPVREPDYRTNDTKMSRANVGRLLKGHLLLTLYKHERVVSLMSLFEE